MPHYASVYLLLTSRANCRLRAKSTRQFVGACLLVCGMIGPGCRGAPPPPEPPRLVGSQDLSLPERQFGHSPRRVPGVTYQPNVVLLENGADAIRGVSNDGLSWTIDSAANGADQIQPGRVLFLTNRAVGRVLAVSKESDGLRVILGPSKLPKSFRRAASQSTSRSISTTR